VSRDAGVERVIVAPGNPGMTDVATVVPVSASDAAALVALARSEGVDLAVVGPEGPLVAGLADTLRAAAIPTVGPGADAARLEGSKDACRELALAAGVPMAAGSTFRDPDAALARVRAMPARRGQGRWVAPEGVTGVRSWTRNRVRTAIAPGVLATRGAVV